MHKEAIILAGGLGTRLRAAVPELPKCMAPVNGAPFIAHVVRYLQQQGVTRFVFALGYKSEAFEAFTSTLSVPFVLSIESEPLGTGGAIQLACMQAMAADVIVTNGDTLFEVDVARLLDFHQQQQADCTLSLKPMQQFDRYGVVEMDAAHRITSFKEKQFYPAGLINGGLYALNRERFLQLELPEKFSFEKDYLEPFCQQQHFAGFVQDAYFIDIGIPEDYSRAAQELALRNT